MYISVGEGVGREGGRERAQRIPLFEANERAHFFSFCFPFPLFVCDPGRTSLMLLSKLWTTLERLERGRTGSSLLQVRFFPLSFSFSFLPCSPPSLRHHHHHHPCSFSPPPLPMLYRVRQDPPTPPKDEPHRSPWNDRLHASSVPRCPHRSPHRCRQRSQAREDSVQEVLPGQR